MFVYRRAVFDPFDPAFVYKRRACSDDLGVAVEHLAKLARRLDLVALHYLEEAQDVADAGERHALLARQVLDELHLDDVPLRVAPAVRGGAVGLPAGPGPSKEVGAGGRFRGLRPARCW